IVSKASEDLPEPETPVTTVRVLCWISKSMFLRLWTRAPRTTMLSIDKKIVPPENFGLWPCPGSAALRPAWSAEAEQQSEGEKTQSHLIPNRIIRQASGKKAVIRQRHAANEPINSTRMRGCSNFMCM